MMAFYENTFRISGLLWLLAVGRLSAQVPELVASAEQQAQTDVAKARFYFTWLAANVAYDTARAAPLAAHIDQPISQNVADVLSHRRALCAGYALTFQALCRASKIPCRYVSGWGIGDTALHAWNLIRLEGRWHGVDVTWAANKHQFMPDDTTWTDYFCMSAPLFNASHRPLDPLLQPQSSDTEGGYLLDKEEMLPDHQQRYVSAARAYKVDSSLIINQLYWNWARLDCAIEQLSVPMALYAQCRDTLLRHPLQRPAALDWKHRLEAQTASLQDIKNLLSSILSQPTTAPMPPIFWEKWQIVQSNIQKFDYLQTQITRYLEN